MRKAFFVMDILFIALVLILAIVLIGRTEAVYEQGELDVMKLLPVEETMQPVQAFVCPHCGEVIESIITTEEPPEPDTDVEVEARYGFTEDDIYILAQLLCGDKNRDGDGEYDIDFQHPDKINYYEVSKVLCVIMNRQRDGRFPNTVKEVVLAKNQFSVFPKNLKCVPSERALQAVRDWCDAYDRFDEGTQVVPENHVFFSGNGYINITRAR